MGNIEDGYRFGQLALRVLDQHETQQFKARTVQMVNGFVLHWKIHVLETLKPLIDAYKSGKETGESQWGHNETPAEGTYSKTGGWIADVSTS